MADLAADYREARPAVSGRLTIRRPHRGGKPHDHHGRHGGTSGYGVTDGALADRLLDPATDVADDAVRSGLFARTLTHARSIDPGFDPRGVHVASLDLGLANYDSASGRRVAATLLECARAIAGVRSAALSTMLPLDGGGLGLGNIKVAGREPPDGQERGWREDWNVVTPGYFATMGIPLVHGRDFAERDRAGAGDVAVLNEAFAAALFPGQDAVGRTLTNGDRVVTIIGVARNAKYRTLGEPQRNFIYVPLAKG